MMVLVLTIRNSYFESIKRVPNNTCSATSLIRLQCDGDGDGGDNGECSDEVFDGKKRSLNDDEGARIC